MSDYCRMKVLRIPFEDANIGALSDYDDLDYDLHEKFGDMFYWCGKPVGKFVSSPTHKPFIDFVLEHEYDDGYGDYGKTRELYPAEKLKYIEVFKRLNPDIDMSRVRLVEFCWYNSGEAPDYYDPKDDDFYSEIPLVCNFI